MAPSILEQSQSAKRGIWRKLWNKKFLIILVIVLAAAGGGYYYVYGQKGSNQSAVNQVRRATAKKQDLKISIPAEGKVVARDGVELSFPVSGNLEVDNVYVKEGDKIKRGDKIASVKTENLGFDLRSANASYQSALANFNSKEAGATASDISKSQAAIAQAQVSLDQSKISLTQAQSNAAQQIASAQSALDSAANNLKSNGDSSHSAIVQNAYSDLVNSVKSVSVTLQRSLHDADGILGIDDTSANTDFKSALGARNAASLAVARSSYLVVKAAKIALDSQISGLDGADQSTIDRVATQAKDALRSLEAHTYDMQVMLDATITFIDLSQAKLDGFKSTISSDRTGATAALGSLDNSIQAVASAKTSLSGLQISYDKAVNDLKNAQNQAGQNISNATISVRSKELSLTQAKNDYNDLLAPPREVDLASARSQLTSAAISVDKARYNMSQATLVSPIDGVISMLNYKKGDTILDNSTTKTVATIINNDTLFIEANIEEADISKLHVGDQAAVTFDAVDGVKLDGEISFISLTSTTSSNGIVTYLVRVLLTNTGESQIREGMTATLDFITAQAKGAIAVPVDAVHNVNGKPAVELASGQFVTVVTGFTDGKQVEIISGLNAGDVVQY